MKQILEVQTWRLVSRLVGVVMCEKRHLGIMWPQHVNVRRASTSGHETLFPDRREEHLHETVGGRPIGQRSRSMKN